VSFVANDSIKQQTKLPDLPLLIADYLHAIFSHIRHLPEDAPAHIVLNQTISVLRGAPPSWKHSLGRPRKTWLQQAEADQGVDFNVGWSYAEDCGMWRSL